MAEVETEKTLDRSPVDFGDKEFLTTRRSFWSESFFCAAVDSSAKEMNRLF